ncbi:Putative toxin component near putative ESAT-related protein, repetitive [Bacillus mycoides]|nr:Putative toxin component near putative ESAT-related protein, repetitive [Bacillus mycoides]
MYNAVKDYVEKAMTDPYAFGGMIFDIGSFCVGVGEVAAVVNGGKIAEGANLFQAAGKSGKIVGKSEKVAALTNKLPGMKNALEKIRNMEIRDLSPETSAAGVGSVEERKTLGTLFSVAKSETKGTGKVYPTRQIDSVAEAHIIDRVKEIRGNLSSKYKKAGNFALAEVDVNSLNKKEFYASSKIDEFKGNLEEKVPEISLKPNEPIFEASLAPGKDGKPYMRDSDTEYKILNEIALKLGDDVNATGKIKLFTELDTCDSCSKVIAEFANKYKNIKLEVIHNNGERLKP